MPERFNIKVKRSGPFYWTWKAYYADGRRRSFVSNGSAFTRKGAFRAAERYLSKWSVNAKYHTFEKTITID